MASGLMQLGNLRWRVNPSSVDWNFQLDVSRVETLGGQVVQILGSTLSDLTISGDFGQDHHGDRVSWQLAEAFNQSIMSMIDQQTQPAKTVPQSRAKKTKAKITDAAPMHTPWVLNYDDGKRKWVFDVLIKTMADPDGGAIVHSNGKFNYRYQLTLFIVNSRSEHLHKVATDYFLSRIGQGLGWRLSKFNGPMTAKDAIHYIQANGGSITAFLDKELTGEDPSAGGDSSSTVPTTPAVPATPITPGGRGGPVKVN